MPVLSPTLKICSKGFLRAKSIISRHLDQESFFFANTDPRPLAYFRIALGTILFFIFIALIPHWESFYGPTGFKVGEPGWIDVFGWFEFVPHGVFWWVGLIASICLTLGFKSKSSAFIMFMLISTMNQTNRMMVNGEDLVLRFILFYCIFACLDGTLSIDSWLRKKKGKSPLTGQMWPIRMIQINTVLIYFFSIPLKLEKDISWLTGDFMYYALVNSDWSRFPWPQLTYEYWFVAPMTYASLLSEFAFACLVWFRPCRLPLVLMLSLFHISIAIILSNVGFFSLSMVVGFLAFLREEDLIKLEKWREIIINLFSKKPGMNKTTPETTPKTSTKIHTP